MSSQHTKLANNKLVSIYIYLSLSIYLLPFLRQTFETLLERGLQRWVKIQKKQQNKTERN